MGIPIGFEYYKVLPHGPICSTLTDPFCNLVKLETVSTENILCGDGKSGLPWEGNFNSHPIPMGILWEFP